MKMKTSLLATSVLALGLFVTEAGAVPISGTIGFGGNVNLKSDADGSVATSGDQSGATTATANLLDFTNAYVLSASGSFAGIAPLTTATFSDFIFSPAMDPNPVDPLWSVVSGSTYTFKLTDVAIDTQNSNTLSLVGHGELNITGGAYDPTPGRWTFSTQSGVFTFSSATVPEPATLALMGLGLAGVALASRRAKRARLSA